MDKRKTIDELALKLDTLELELKLGESTATPGWKPGDPVEYMRKEVPQFRVPEYAGVEYEDMVPDTLDLQDRATLAVNVLTELPDPKADYEGYFWVNLGTNPLMMQHDFDSPLNTIKFMESLPLMRIISGSRQNEQVDKWWMEKIQRQIGPDGIAYIPTKGRPWAFLGTQLLFRGAEDIVPKRAEPFICPFYCGRFLSVIALHHKRDKGKLWKDIAERMVDGLADMAAYKDNYAYFGPHVFWAQKGNTIDPSDNWRLFGLETRSIILGLTHVYRETEYKPAIDLAQKLISYVLVKCRAFDSEGRFNVESRSIGDEKDPQGRHFHTHSFLLQSILEYARATGDNELMELVKKGYEYAKTQGNVELGYFPEHVEATYRRQGSELCDVADMIALGLKLTEAGAGDYWADVDRWARNMFAEGQLTEADWLNRLAEKAMPMKINRINQTTERVAERNIGAFASFPTANDWAGGCLATSSCCTAQGSRAIYYLWQNILKYESGELKVNLLLNRASEWADIHSHIPYNGQVDVKVKKELNLLVRVPEWTDRNATRCEVDGKEVTFEWEGYYARIGKVKPATKVTLRFPIAERAETICVEKENYTIVRKGNEVVSIDPSGTYYPLYQRRHYRQNETRWKKTRRFISEEKIYW